MNPTKSLIKFPDSFTKEDNCSGQLAVSSWQLAVGSWQFVRWYPFVDGYMKAKFNFKKCLPRWIFVFIFTSLFNGIIILGELLHIYLESAEKVKCGTKVLMFMKRSHFYSLKVYQQK